MHTTLSTHVSRPWAGMSRPWLALGLLMLVACGGVSRRTLVEGPRDSWDTLFEALIQVSGERGLSARPRRGGVSVLVDRERGARITFAPRRNGLNMSVGVRTEEDGDDRELAVAEAELGRLEALGQELIQAARERARHLDEARAAAEARERELATLRRAEEEAAARDDEARRRELAAFMAGNDARLDAHVEAHRADPPSGPAPSSAPAASATCCLNGAFYACPDASAVDRCAGAFTRCLMACDFTCTDTCMSESPPDPSSCRRDPARDGEC